MPWLRAWILSFRFDVHAFRETTKIEAVASPTEAKIRINPYARMVSASLDAVLMRFWP